MKGKGKKENKGEMKRRETEGSSLDWAWTILDTELDKVQKYPNADFC